jgi:hypothetical protein
MVIREDRPATAGLSDAARDREVRQEIENFLNALSSYPDRFARDPYVSFEEHLFIVSAENQVSAGGADRRRSYR